MAAQAPDYVPQWGAANDRVRMHTLSMGIECTYCAAPIGAPCVNPLTGYPLSWRLPAHTPRLIAVGYGHHDSESHAQRPTRAG